MRRSFSLVPVLSVAIALGLGGAGCGGGGFDSGVDEDKPFNTLTAEESASACQSFAAYVEGQLTASEQAEISCTGQALGTTTTPDACRAAVTTCLAGEPMRVIGMIDCSTPMASIACGARVGDVERCITAEVSGFTNRLSMVSCDLAGDVPAITALQAPLPVPSQCAALEPTCPELADGLFGR